VKAKAATPSERMITLDVSLLGHEYKAACKEGEEAELRDAVALLDRRMREIRETSKITSTERIAVMAALNLAHEFQRERRPGGAESLGNAGPSIVDASTVRRRIASMKSAIDQLLAGQDKRS
jgi:cell division protein ZapA